LHYLYAVLLKCYNLFTLDKWGGITLSMFKNSALLETLRWGQAHVPGVIFFYSQELELDVEDIGILSTIFYTFESKSKPLYQTGVNVGQVLQCCPALTKNKLARKLAKYDRLNLIKVAHENSKNFTDRVIFLEPMLDKLETLVNRDHPQFSEINTNDTIDAEKQLDEYRQLIEQLELELEEEKSKRLDAETREGSKNSSSYKKIADFIASKTGNLMSVKMANELKKWLYDLNFQPEFLFCVLEMCFERNISNPRTITKIASDIKEYSINSLEGLEMYFSNYTGSDQNKMATISQFNPDIAEFGSFTGIDMSAEARKLVYYKWRYDWGFSHKMIMKAGEVMCQRTRNGGLEYIDSVLKNWMAKEIRLVEDAEKEMEEYKNRTKKDKPAATSAKKTAKKQSSGDYEIYVPPASIK
jgi:DNA replication protein DnaD